MAFSPGGLAIGDSRGGVKLWNVASGQQMLELGNVNVPNERIEFSADGRRLFVHQWPNNGKENSVHDEILVFEAGTDAP